MKALKIILFAILGLFVLLIVAIGLLALPGVQRGIVTRVVAVEPGEQLDVDYFHAGFNNTKVRGLVFSRADSVYQVDELTADLSLFGLLFRRELRIDELHVTGLLIDLSAVEAEEKKEPFEGILTDLPMPLYLNRLRVEGQVILPGRAEEPMQGDFVLSGGGFAPGEEGELQLIGDLEMSRPTTHFAALGVEGNLMVQQGEEGRIERARLHALISAPGVEMAPGEALSADVLLLATEEGEAYEARVGRVQKNAAGTTDLSTIVVLDATYNHSEGLMQGRWELQVDQDQLAAFLGEMELPSFAATGSGEFSYGLAGELVDVAGQVDVEIDDLRTVAENLGELGGFALSSRFNIGMDESAFRLDELEVEVRDEQGANLLEVRNFQPIHYDREAESLRGGEERLDLAELTIQALPVEWANLFLPAESDGGGAALRGGNLTGQLVVSAEDGAILFRLLQPLQAEGIAFLSGGEEVLANLSFELNGSGSFRDGRLEGTVEPLQLLHQGEPFLAVSGTFDSAAQGMEASLEADLPVLLRLPILADYNNLSSGTAELTVSFGEGELLDMELNGAARNLVTRDEQMALADVTFRGILRQTAEHAWDIELPLRLEGEEPSDLLLAGELAMEGEVTNFDLNLTGEYVRLEEMTGLASAFSAPEDPAAGGAPAPSPAPGGEPPAPGRDEEPVWAGMEGSLAVNVATIQLQGEQTLEELRGEVTVEPDSVVKSFRANLAESPVKVDSRLRFIPAEERPYLLDGLVEVPSLATGELFRQLQPDQPPTVEGLFGGTIEIESTGNNVADLMNRVRWVAKLGSSGSGVLRLLQTDNPMAGLGLAATAILGTVQEETRAISAVANRLSNMPYDEINLLAERDEDLNIVLRDFLVLSPELHLNGVGVIRHREGVEVLQQPMEIRLTMGALGPLQEQLEVLRVLGNQEDNRGYMQLREPFVITGTPADPNSTAFYRMLVDTALRFIDPDEDEEEGQEEDGPRIPGVPDIFDILGGRRG